MTLFFNSKTKKQKKQVQNKKKSPLPSPSLEDTVIKRKSESFISPEVLTNQMDAVSLEEENDKLKDQMLCKVMVNILQTGI